MKKAYFIGFNALGDLLCTTPTLKAFRQANPKIFITYIVQNATFCRVLEYNPDVDLVLYNEQMYLYGLTQYSQTWFNSLPLDIQEESLLYQFDVNQVCSREESFHEHISTGFSKLLDIPITSVQPVVQVTAEERRLARSFMRNPVVIFSMHSNANPQREHSSGGAKDWPETRWLKLAETIHQWGDFDVIAVGAEKDSQIQCPHIRNLYGLPIKIVAALLQEAALVVTLENGLAHLAHAVNANMIQIYSNIVPEAWAYPKECRHCRVFYDDPLNISFEEIMNAAQTMLSKENRQQ